MQPEQSRTTGKGTIAVDLQRAALLLGKIIRFGLLPLGRLLPWTPRSSFAVRLRLAIEDLGLTYLKLGQFLALRFDILPADVCRELNNLFESVKPMPVGVAVGIIESELQAQMSELYTDFSAEPIAAASVGQVHTAYLKNGQHVVVKVQRSGLRPIFEADIRNLGRIASLIDAAGVFGKLSAKGMLDEFARWTLRELDFTIEGRTAERVSAASQGFVLIPAVCWGLTTKRVLTMEYVEGVSASQLANLMSEGGMELVHARLPGLDLQLSLKRFAKACLKQLFTIGFFHGDPHPGNVLFRNDNRVVFLDFGIFGSLSRYEREVVAGQIENLATGNIEASYRFYEKQLIPTNDSDLERLRKEAMEVLQRWYRTSMNQASSPEEKHLAKYTGQMIEISRRNHVRYGLNYLLFWRALNLLNATLLLVAPQFELMKELRDFFHDVRPGLIPRWTEVVQDPARRWRLVEAATLLPRAAEQLLNSLEASRFVLESVVIEDGTQRKDRNRQTAGLLIALLLIPGVVLSRRPETRVVGAALIVSVAGTAALHLRRRA